MHHPNGHVVLARYKAMVVEKDNYLLEFARYLVLDIDP